MKKSLTKKIYNKFITNIETYIIEPILNFILPIEYAINKKSYGVNTEEDRKNEIIISLTSIPSRFSTLHLCIERLLNQTLKPDKIILYLGNNTKNIKLTKQLKEQMKRGLTVKYCDDTKLRPHTKYFYAMQEYHNDIIITVDDDIIYSKKLVEKLMESYKKFPDAVSYVRGHKMTTEDGKIKPYQSWIWEYREKDAMIPNNKIFPTGVGGILYPPDCFDEETFDIEKIKELCINNDDIWLKAMELRNNINVVRVDKKRNRLYAIKQTQKIALSKNNVIANKNDDYLASVFKYYNIKIEEE